MTITDPHSGHRRPGTSPSSCQRLDGTSPGPGQPLTPGLDRRPARRAPVRYSCEHGGPGGAVTAYTNTWALGALKPGADGDLQLGRDRGQVRHAHRSVRGRSRPERQGQGRDATPAAHPASGEFARRRQRLGSSPASRSVRATTRGQVVTHAPSQAARPAAPAARPRANLPAGGLDIGIVTRVAQIRLPFAASRLGDRGDHSWRLRRRGAHQEGIRTACLASASRTSSPRSGRRTGAPSALPT